MKNTDYQILTSRGCTVFWATCDTGSSELGGYGWINSSGLMTWSHWMAHLVAVTDAWCRVTSDHPIKLKINNFCSRQRHFHLYIISRNTISQAPPPKCHPSSVGKLRVNRSIINQTVIRINVWTENYNAYLYGSETVLHRKRLDQLLQYRERFRDEAGALKNLCTRTNLSSEMDWLSFCPLHIKLTTNFSAT